MATPAFLLGQMSSYGKSVQFEELSGRENQYGLYVADRWQVNEKLTLNLGLRYEYYPLMTRQDRGIELLDVPTFNVKLGGLGGNPKDLGIKVSKTLFAPRVRRGVSPERRHRVPRRLRPDVQPAAVDPSDARTVPAHDRLQRRRPERVHPVRQHRQRHRTRADPGPLARQPAAAARRGHDDARSGQHRSRHDALLERGRRAPAAAGFAVSVGYVGTRTDGQVLDTRT